MQTLAMDKTEVWEVIKEFGFLMIKIKKKVQKATGLRYEDIKEAVKSHEIDEIKNAEKVKQHVINRGIFTESKIMDIIEPCLTDLRTVDAEKAIEFHDRLAEVEPNKQKNVMKVAKAIQPKEVVIWVKKTVNR